MLSNRVIADFCRRPLVTIVTVVYNAEDTIIDTILSVLSQTYSNIEYIVVDGASTDSTPLIIDGFSDKIDVIVREPDDGIFDAMNKGLKLATGDYINFMNAGDTFVNPQVIESIFSSLEEPADFIYGHTIFNRKGKLSASRLNPFFDVRGVCAMGICHQSIFLNTKLANKYPFDTSFLIAADYNMIFSVFKYENPKVFYYDKAIAIFEADDGISSRNYTKSFMEIIRIYHFRSVIDKFIFLVISYVKYAVLHVINKYR
jgi:glycosyltransferase involved in cell wall biosynthesis